MGKNKKAKKFAHKQKKANLRNKSRGKKTVTIRDAKRKKKEQISLEDTHSDDEGPLLVEEGGKPFLKDFLEVNTNEMSVEDFLEADMSSEEEDNEVPSALQEPPTKKRKLNEPMDHIEKHKADLELLKEIDPEFYEHLKENASSLLDFGADHVPEEEPEAKEKEVSEIEASGDQEKKEESEPEDMEDEEEEVHVLKKFTKKDLDHLQKEVKKSPMSGLKKLVIAFKSATALHNDEEGQTLLHFTDTEVFSAFLSFMITEVPDIMSSILKVKPGEKLGGKLLNTRPWHRLRPLCRSYITCYANFLQSRDQDETKQFLLFNLRKLIPFLGALKSDATSIMKLCVSLWAYGSAGVKKDAFLTILEMSLKMHHSILEVALKHMYLTFVKCVRKVNDKASSRAIDFMITSLVEMYGINTVISYQHGFIYIRQLAIHLQKAMKNQQEGTVNTKKGQKRQSGGKKKGKKKRTGKHAHMEVYNWRFLTCLRLFTKILSRHVNTVNDELYPLVYPLVEISLSLVSFNKGAIWFPLKIHLSEMLIEIVQNCGIHIPVAPILLDLLRWPGLRKNIKASTIVQMDLQFLLKVKDGELRTKACHEALVETATQLLMSYFGAYSCSVAFPELAFPIMGFLKSMVRDDDKLHTKFKKQINVVAKKLKENSEWIKSKREKSDLAPKDVTKINTFTDDCQSSPLHRYLAGKAPAVKENEPDVEAFLEEESSDEVDKSEVGDDEDNTEAAAEGLVHEALQTASGDVIGELELSDSDDE